MASIQAQAVHVRDPLPAQREPRRSLDRAIQEVRRDHGIHFGAYVAVATLRELLDEIEAAA